MLRVYICIYIHMHLSMYVYTFHSLSPGSAFFLPHGTRIYNKWDITHAIEMDHSLTCILTVTHVQHLIYSASWRARRSYAFQEQYKMLDLQPQSEQTPRCCMWSYTRAPQPDRSCGIYPFLCNTFHSRLLSFIRDEYWKRGYEEVTSPNIFNMELWNISGHALHYKEVRT